MITAFEPLLIGAGTSRIVYEANPIVPMFQWWQVALLTGVVALLTGFSIWIVRRDTRDLPRSLFWLLLGMRITVILLIVLFVLEPQRRCETTIVKKSRIPILIDTSLSMNLQHSDTISSERRIEKVITQLKGRDFWKQLVSLHDVEVYRFDENSQPELIVSSRDTSEDSGSNIPPSLNAPTANDQKVSAVFGGLFFALVFGGLTLLAISFWPGRTQRSPNWFAAGWALVSLALLCLAICDLATVEWPWHRSLSTVWSTTGPLELASNNSQPTTVETEPIIDRLSQFDWPERLKANGTATRLGDALQYLINKERGGPIAGIMVITDGGVNAGIDVVRVALSAESSNIPLYPIGIGGLSVPKNLQITQLQLPAKAFPGDRFFAKATLQNEGFSGVAKVQIVSTDDGEKETEVIEDKQEVALDPTGPPTLVEFELKRDVVGPRRFKVRAMSLPDETETADNVRSAVVDIVDQKSVVLLIAGGPHRDFQFLRNQLFRDPTIDLHVLLQSAKSGADQEGDKILTEFPNSMAELDAIDCIVAFDPDWSRFNVDQSRILEEWLADKSGGLIVTAGPVNAPIWIRQPPRHPVISLIRRIYPVVFYNQSSAVLSLGRFGGERAYPLEFTREGSAAEFLWLGNTSAESQKNWSRTDGVYGYYAVNEAKPGADILAHFSDPTTATNDKLPIYLASQYYGSGRVVFQASSEVWRMRRVDVEFFHSYYDKLIRWASQGRLNRNSKNGFLLTDKQNYWVGDQVTLQAILQPVDPNAVPVATIPATVVAPNGELTTVTLNHQPAAPRKGTYAGSFAGNSEGDYRIRLLMPGRADSELLTCQVGVSIPDLEKRHSERNDAVLRQLADKTGGKYWNGFSDAMYFDNDPGSLQNLILPQDQESVLPGAPDRIFRQKLMAWLLLTATFLLACQWIIRRLNKLA